MKTYQTTRARNLGFTILELLVSLAIIAILLTIAVPSYFSYATKSRRSDGISSILNIQLAQERYRAQNTQYATLAQLGISATSAQGYYALAVTNVGATTYTITAIANSTQENDSEGTTSCATLTLTMSQATTTQTPAACWPN